MIKRGMAKVFGLFMSLFLSWGILIDAISSRLNIWLLNGFRLRRMDLFHWIPNLFLAFMSLLRVLLAFLVSTRCSSMNAIIIFIWFLIILFHFWFNLGNRTFFIAIFDCFSRRELFNLLNLDFLNILILWRLYLLNKLLFFIIRLLL